MIVKNEEKTIGNCLSSCSPFADEIIVVDTGSSDQTVQIAREHNVRLFSVEWKDDFSLARNESLTYARGKWILWLDADDIVPRESIEKINTIKRTQPDRVVGCVVRNQKPGNTGSEFRQARMFPNRPEVRFERRIHEQIMLSAMRQGLTLEQSDIVIEHHGYADPEQVQKKARRNIKLLLQEFDRDHPDAVMALELGDSFLLIGNGEEACQWYEKVLDMPGITQSMPVIASHALLGVGKICNEQGAWEKACRVIRQSLELVPQRPDALYSLAVAYELNGKPLNAVECLEKIIASSSHNTLQVSVDFREARLKALLRLERLYRQENLDQKMENLVAMKATFRGRPEFRNVVARDLLHKGHLLEALHEFEQSLQIASRGNLDAFIGLCVIYRRARKKDALSRTLTTLQSHWHANPRFVAAVCLLEGEKEARNRYLMEPPNEEAHREMELLRTLYQGL